MCVTVPIYTNNHCLYFWSESLFNTFGDRYEIYGNYVTYFICSQHETLSFPFATEQAIVIAFDYILLTRCKFGIAPMTWLGQEWIFYI